LTRCFFSNAGHYNGLAKVLEKLEDFSNNNFPGEQLESIRTLMGTLSTIAGQLRYQLISDKGELFFGYPVKPLDAFH
jgi:hypothetical protein